MSRRWSRVRIPLLLLAAVVGSLARPTFPAAAQISGEGAAVDEGRLLRAASLREARGDFAGAERILLELLDRNPASAGALFALERVLRAQGRLEDVLGPADAHLAAAPDADGARYMKLRVLAELDSLEALRAEGEAWIAVDPGSAEPYREVARILERTFGVEPALEVLRRGQAAIADPSALSIEVGDLLVRTGRPGEAVSEWSRALGDDATQANTVLRRVGQLGPEREEVARALVERLDGGPTTLDRRRAAVRVALENGLPEDAVRIARSVVPELEGQARRGFLLDLARRAEEAGEDVAVLWVYRSLREEGIDPEEVRALDQRIAEAALAAGDSSAALEAQRRVARHLPPATPERRRALVTALRLEAAMGEREELRRSLTAFREEFPDAPELDELAAALAAALHARGDEEGAAEVLDGVEGPRSALERGYLHFDAGDLDAGREALAASVDGLTASGATEVVQLLTLLDRLGPDAADAVAEAAVRAHRGRPGEGARILREVEPEVEAADRPAVVAMAARLADRGGEEEQAASLRERLMAAYPDAPETPEAMLALARYRGRSTETVAEAVELLETLILNRPNSPVVPDARRELQRLRGRIPGDAS